MKLDQYSQVEFTKTLIKTASSKLEFFAALTNEPQSY